MSEEYEEYLKFLENNKDYFIANDKSREISFRILGPNNSFIELKKTIGLNYFCTDELDIIYIEDITEKKQLTNDLDNKPFKLHLTENILYIDFNTNYYYELLDFETFPQFNYCQKYKKITIALLNDDKSDIINKWTTNINLL